MKIVVLDGYAGNPGDISWDGLQALGHVVVYDRTAPADVVARCQDADAMLTNKVVIGADVMDALPRLKYIGVLATGYNVVDLDAAGRHGVVVTNIPSYSTSSVAQMVFAHLLNITNRVGHYTRQIRRGRWCESPDFTYWDTPLTELEGKRMGIVGLGSIGTAVARLAVAFGMEVSAVTSKASSSLPEHIRKMTFDGLMATSDVVSLHCPLTPDTREMINRDSLSGMKRGAILINTGRGPLVCEQDVADALCSGRLGAYAADVMTLEPPAPDNPLFACPNAFFTPHVAWATLESRQRLMDVAVSNLKHFLSGQPVNVVNKL